MKRPGKICLVYAAHTGLVAALGAALRGASWQRSFVSMVVARVAR
jgi:hypothetical protein